MLDATGWRPAEMSANKPKLLVLVDTEEEFDWSRPISRANVGTRSIAAQQRAHRIFERFGIRPTYVIDYPVAEDGFRPLYELFQDGLCDIGAHLHPWVNPPHDEDVSGFNSFPGNLPDTLEREKLFRLTTMIEDRFGFHPTIYKAGRYGVGAATTSVLTSLNYEIDASVVPESDFRSEDGPDFRACGAKPYWFGPGQDLLEIPMSVGFTGLLCQAGNRAYRKLRSKIGMACHLPGVLARLRLFERIRLTPEGQTFEELKRLTATMIGSGHRVFSFTYHSPSLEPGHTPYVRNQDELDRFLDCCERYFDYFIHGLGGEAATPFQIKAALSRKSTSGQKLGGECAS